jgi:hypothetical protein
MLLREYLAVMSDSTLIFPQLIRSMASLKHPEEYLAVPCLGNQLGQT